ncbi:hypothetical protein B0T17DRAFT_383369 [Bombardia bombarda]|uniref:Ubiquitin-like domain-containing protein n=1 Tax=Bombardia bombarda TaxID=252184 RepID=A0AA40BVL5_9PEZI|nr:hypothetical protein B0T17DRAFT_383369 [Bombardia bombarda]
MAPPRPTARRTSFLRALSRTLGSLQALSVLDHCPNYGPEIRDQVDHIRPPIEAFLADVRKYEPGLGPHASPGRHHNIKQKLQWHIFVSRDVKALRGTIEAHMRVLDTLMSCLTLDLVWTAGQRLPQQLQSVIDTLRPELTSHLEHQLESLSDGTTGIESAFDRLESGTARLESSLHLLHQNQRRAFDQLSKIRLANAIKVTPVRIARRPTRTVKTKVNTRMEGGEGTATAAKTGAMVRIAERHETLQEIYYLVLLYLGRLLKNILLSLNHLLEPSRALSPTLLAESNITFLDALGRQPRVLPYDFFRGIKVLEAFIQTEFSSLPGSTLVNGGEYLLLNQRDNHELNERNWSETIMPGDTVHMLMRMDNLVQHSYKPLDMDVQQCPAKGCHGVCAIRMCWMYSTLGHGLIGLTPLGTYYSLGGMDVSTFKRVVLAERSGWMARTAINQPQSESRRGRLRERPVDEHR